VEGTLVVLELLRRKDIENVGFSADDTQLLLGFEDSAECYGSSQAHICH
jgi:hypothetical protein